MTRTAKEDRGSKKAKTDDEKTVSQHADEAKNETKDEVKNETKEGAKDEGAVTMPLAPDTVIAAKAIVEQPAAASGDVLVYCKLPNGMKFPTKTGVVELNGTNSAILVGGYGRTPVPREEWEYIIKIYGGMKVFKKNNPVIFAADSAKYGDDMANEAGRSVRSGLEKKNPKEIIDQTNRLASRQ